MAGKPSPARGPRVVRRCPVCGHPVHFWTRWVEGDWEFGHRHPRECRRGPALTLLGETLNGRGDWTAFALRLGLPATILDECVLRLYGLMPPTEKGAGRLLTPLERLTVLRVYYGLQGDDGEPEEV